MDNGGWTGNISGSINGGSTSSGCRSPISENDHIVVRWVVANIVIFDTVGVVGAANEARETHILEHLAF